MNPDSFSPSHEATEAGPLNSLPLTVTSVSPQKKNSDRFSLFHDNLFLIGVSSQTLTSYSLKEGTRLTRDLYNKLVYAEELRAAKDRAYRLLARRDHGSEELRRKLLNKDLDSNVVEEVIFQCREKDLLNDYSYASSFAHDKFHLRSWGPRKIESALFSKGIPPNVITRVISDLQEQINPVEACTELVLKRRKHFLREPDSFKREQKIFRYLAGKGYSSEKIKQAMPNITRRLDA